MMFESINDALHMQGHGFYVWLSYGITWLTMISLIVLPLRKKAAVLREIAQRDKAEQLAARKKQNPSNSAMKESN